MNIIARIKHRLGLCDIKRWHFAPTYREYHGLRYCAECWRREMTYLNTGTRAWRIEHMGDVGRTPALRIERAEQVVMPRRRARQ